MLKSAKIFRGALGTFISHSDFSKKKKKKTKKKTVVKIAMKNLQGMKGIFILYNFISL